MHYTIQSAGLNDIQHLRAQFLAEAAMQFVHDKCHRYGWADVYSFTAGGKAFGYGAVWGVEKREGRDCIFEFFLLPAWRPRAGEIYRQLIATSGVQFLECQTNDLLLAGMVFQHAHNIAAWAILFEDAEQTNLPMPPDTAFLQKSVTNDHPSDVGGFMLRVDGIEAATGGFLTNYNAPYADIYMEVHDAYRGRGLGSLIVQELKKECYARGLQPAARCNPQNIISQATLQRAGFRICGYMLQGQVKAL